MLSVSVKGVALGHKKSRRAEGLIGAIRMGLVLLLMGSVIGCWTGKWQVKYPKAVTKPSKAIISGFGQLDVAESSTYSQNIVRLKESVQKTDASYAIARSLKEAGIDAVAMLNASHHDLTPGQVLVTGAYYPIARSVAAKRDRLWPAFTTGLIHIATAMIFPVLPTMTLHCGYHVNVMIVDGNGAILEKHEQDIYRVKNVGYLVGLHVDHCPMNEAKAIVANVVRATMGAPAVSLEYSE
jgi:hypothetical protein